MKNTMDRLKSEFALIQNSFAGSQPIGRMIDGSFGVEHYKSCLRETYFYTRENPQIQAFATVFFRGDDRKLVRHFYRHASQEIGHDQLALNDLGTLGEDIGNIPNERALPTTLHMVALPYYLIQHRNPASYLGYLFFLEFLPTGSGAVYMDLLEKCGIPRSAMTFLRDHTEIDVQHNRMMEEYADVLVRDDADLGDVIYAMRATGRTYTSMLEGAIVQADSPADWGLDEREIFRKQAPITLAAE